MKRELEALDHSHGLLVWKKKPKTSPEKGPEAQSLQTDRKMRPEGYCSDIENIIKWNGCLELYRYFIWHLYWIAQLGPESCHLTGGTLTREIAEEDWEWFFEKDFIFRNPCDWSFMNIICSITLKSRQQVKWPMVYMRESCFTNVPYSWWGQFSCY